VISKRSALVSALAAAILATALVVSGSFGSSHREAPLISLDPTADNTDLYAFTAPDALGKLTLVSNWIPFEDPAGGPNFYKFDQRARYWLNIDNTGDGRPDVRFLFTFKDHVRNPNSFLYAAPPVNSIHSPNLNEYQTYSVTLERYRHGHEVSHHVLARNLTVAPNNVGPKTMPNYGALANQAIAHLAGGGKVFTGQRDDPFFVDLGATFDALTIRKGTGNAGGGKDDLAGYNVHSIVLQVPDAMVTRDGKPVSGPAAANAVVGVWTSTDRQVVRVSHHHARRHWVQVSRLGNPLVNEVVIPLKDKDKFNATTPNNDAANYGKFVLKPELAHLLNVLYPGLNVPETHRTDIVEGLLTGIPGKTRIAPNAVPADTLKINLGVPPSSTPNRLGVLGGDLAGFPDGRRLTDDVVDISERVVGGFLVGHKLPLGDGVDQNDVPYLSTFPYVAAPHDGLHSTLKRFEPTHPPTP
jgi:Domain of unknown function (DUF4331)